MWYVVLSNGPLPSFFFKLYPLGQKWAHLGVTCFTKAPHLK